MANPFFNAEYYLEKNPDVAAAVGGDKEIAEQHYFLHGAAEALNGDVADRKPAPWFDIQFYANSRADLADVPADQLFLHFVLHGMREGLSPMEGVEFDPVAYASAEGNEDLLEAFGIEDVENLTEDEALLLQQHFFAHGYREGREGGPEIPGYDPDNGGDIDYGELTKLLEAVKNAENDLADFLDDVAEGNAFVAAALAGELETGDDGVYIDDQDELDGLAAEDENNPTAEEVIAAINANQLNADLGVAAAVDGVNTVIGDAGDLLKETYTDAVYNVEGSDRAKEAGIADAKENVASAIAEIQKEVAKISGLEGKINTFANRVAQYEAALKGVEEAGDNLDREVLVFGALNASDGEPPVPLEVDGLPEYDFASLEDATITDGTKPIAHFKAATGRWEADEDADFEGLADFVAALQADFNAQKNANTAEGRLVTAISNVVNAENELTGDDAITATAADISLDDGEVDIVATLTDVGGGDTDAPLSAYLLVLREVAAGLDEVVEELEAAKQLVGNLSDLEEALQEQMDAIEEAGYDVTFLDGEDYSGTEANDIFVFSDLEGEEFGIDLFGEQGQDSIFFGGGYELVALGDTEITERVGNADQLEIFWAQNGDDLVLYVEADPAAGQDRGDAAFDEITTIVLTGVDFDNTDFAEGYFFAGTAV